MALPTQFDAAITHGMEKPSYTAEQFDKVLKMCAAIWACATRQTGNST